MDAAILALNTGRAFFKVLTSYWHAASLRDTQDLAPSKEQLSPFQTNINQL